MEQVEVMDPNEYMTAMKPKKPCPFCINRADMHLKPCKHLYQRLRWEANRNAKDCTEGEPANAGAHVSVPTGERNYHFASLPTFFSSYGEWIVPENRRVWRLLKKRHEREKVDK